MCLINITGFNTGLLLLQLHVKDLNKTIWYMYHHKKYRKVNKHIRSCEIKSGAGREIGLHFESCLKQEEAVAMQ